MRLIDADALFTAFENAKWYDNNDRDLVAEDILMDAPTIDAVPVIRCGKCKYRGLAKVNCKGFTICPVSGMEISDDDYCSYGEPMGHK